MKRRDLHAWLWLVLPSISAMAGEVTVWTTGEMQRVMRGDAPEESAPVHLRAARGEWESFQVVVHADATVFKDIQVVGGALTSKESSTSLPAPVVLREHYVRVTRSTPMSALPPGDYPDALLPQNLPPPAENVPEGICNQPFWVDVFVPYGSDAGTYEGTLEVRLTKDQPPIPVRYSVEVWDIDLPVVPRLRSSFGLTWRRLAEVHGFDRDASEPAPALTDIIERYAELLAEHRISVDQIEATYPDGATGTLNKPVVERAMRDHLLHRHAANLGLPIWPDWPFADPLGKDRAAAQRYAADWMKLLANFRAESRGYVIMGSLDEPNDADAYDTVRSWGRFFNEASETHGISIPLLITEQPTPDQEAWGTLNGLVDIWVPHVGSVWEDMEAPDGRRDIARRIDAGDEVWTYAALVQCPDDWEHLHGNPKKLTQGHPPVWALDYAPINHRILTWLMPLHRITGLAYWDMLYAAEGVDVWADAGSFHHPDGDIYNGDGSYLYPATKVRFGLDAPVASMRLKWIRESAEDYDYLMMAADRGLGDEARRLTETFARGFGDWEDDIEALHRARAALAERMVEKQAMKGGGT